MSTSKEIKVGFLEWYFGLDWYWRLLIPLIFLGISAYLFFVEKRIWFLGWALGGVLLITCIPSGKKSEYGDW